MQAEKVRENLEVSLHHCEQEKIKLQGVLQSFENEISAVKHQLSTLQIAHENSERIRRETENFVTEVVRVNDMLVQSL